RAAPRARGGSAPARRVRGAGRGWSAQACPQGRALWQGSVPPPSSDGHLSPSTAPRGTRTLVHIDPIGGRRDSAQDRTREVGARAIEDGIASVIDDRRPRSTGGTG